MTAISALIAALATCLVVGVTFAGFTITKDLKTTESRQKWINDQRSDLAIVISSARRLARLQPDKQKTFDLTKFEAAAARIALREKPQEIFAHIERGRVERVYPYDSPEWTRILAAAERIRVYAATGTANPTLIDSALVNVIDEARKALKVEWERVKIGEHGYRYTKWSLFIGGCVVVIAAIGIASATGALDARTPALSLTITRP